MKSFTLVIPAYNEEGNLASLIKEIFTNNNKLNFELIIVDDYSNDNTKLLIEELKKKYPIIYILNERNLGQSMSIYLGIKQASYNTIVTLDGDGQNNPRDISRLLTIYFSESSLKLVGGVRKKRKDSLIKIISSKIANRFRALLLKDNCPDTGCSLKVFDKDIFLNFPFFDGIHRFLPALFKGYGYSTKFVDVDHRPRKMGISKYGTFKRLFKGLYDIVKVINILRNLK